MFCLICLFSDACFTWFCVPACGVLRVMLTMNTSFTIDSLGTKTRYPAVQTSTGSTGPRDCKCGNGDGSSLPRPGQLAVGAAYMYMSVVTMNHIKKVAMAEPSARASHPAPGCCMFFMAKHATRRLYTGLDTILAGMTHPSTTCQKRQHRTDVEVYAEPCNSQWSLIYRFLGPCTV